MTPSIINNIIFPTDFSENAQNALIYALEIASHTGATLHILHSIEEPYDFAPMAEEIKTGVTSRVEQLLNEMVSEIEREDRFKEIQIQTYIQNGNVHYALMEEVQECNADLIVMGTRGRSGLKKMLFGSTTAEVVQHSEVPVLAVPMHATFSGLSHLLFVTDYHDNDLIALDYVTDLANAFDSKITIFHSALSDDLETEIKFRGFRELVRVSTDYKAIEFDQVKSIEFLEALANQLESNDFSMLVMIKYQKPVTLFENSQSVEMSFYSTIPLLVIPE